VLAEARLCCFKLLLGNTLPEVGHDKETSQPPRGRLSAEDGAPAGQHPPWGCGLPKLDLYGPACPFAL